MAFTVCKLWSVTKCYLLVYSCHLRECGVELAKCLDSCLQMFVICILEGLGVGSHFQLPPLARTVSQWSTQMSAFCCFIRVSELNGGVLRVPHRYPPDVGVAICPIVLLLPVCLAHS